MTAQSLCIPNKFQKNTEKPVFYNLFQLGISKKLHNANPSTFY